MVGVNLVGTFNVLRLAAAAMAKTEPTRDGERGVIVNTASVAAFDGQIGQVAYAASKAGVVGMTLPAARDLAPARHPRRHDRARHLRHADARRRCPRTSARALGADVVFPKRLGDPPSTARSSRAIVENAILNGETIRLDGALRMPPK